MDIGKDIGLKLTPQRLAIFEYLNGNRSHPTAEDIYKEVSKRFPTMSLATVYNTLDALIKKGSIRELTIEPGKKRFDPDTSAHHHLICIGCRAITDVFEEFRPCIGECEKNGYEIIGTHIEFYGICPVCRDLQNTHLFGQ